MVLLHRIDDWYMIVVREMQDWSYCIHCISFFKARDFYWISEIPSNLESIIILQLGGLRLGQRSRILNAIFSIDLDSSFWSVSAACTHALICRDHYVFTTAKISYTMHFIIFCYFDILCNCNTQKYQNLNYQLIYILNYTTVLQLCNI